MEWSIGFILGLIVGQILAYLIYIKYPDLSERIKYTLDITLKKPGESTEDFITRAHKENLGIYMLID